MRLVALVFGGLVLAPAIARADDALAKKLVAYEAEAHQLGTDLPRPNAPATSPHRLVDAQVAYSLGDYDAAALMLFDLVGNNPATASGPDGETAVFYLADSLYEKGDRGAAHGYFALLAKNPAGRYYQRSLERLVEIAIAQNDPTGVDDYLARLPSSPYVHGKWLFAQRKYDEAVGYFNNVPKGNDSELQAQYYIGAAAVAKSDLARATEIYAALVDHKPKSANDRRVIELAQLALGRVYYEREQPAKSIDAYLLVDRHSDLFPDALYEVSWVYVRSKQYDKALRALELLEQEMPASTKTATVRILEGNLRIRKAQALRGAQINGTANSNEKDDPATEYDKANVLFAETNAQYAPSYRALSNNKTDPSLLVEQVAGRHARVFQVVQPIPDVAAQLLRDEPSVQRVVSIENDLGDIQTDIEQTEATIARLEGVLAAGAKANAYPELAARRHRVAQISDDLIKIRADLADQQEALVGTPGDVPRVSSTRKQYVAGFAPLQAAEQQSASRLSASNQAFDQVDEQAIGVENVLGSAQAMAIALRTYADSAGAKLSDEQRAALAQQLDTIGKDAAALEDELVQLRRDATTSRDLARVVDEAVITARAARAQIKAAQDDEQRVLAGFAASSTNQGKSQELASLADRAGRVAEQLAQVDKQIEAAVAQGLSEVRSTIDSARKDLDAYKRELGELSAEARQAGGGVLAGSFKDVKDKLYDIVIRSDVGTVDVAWSQKEDTDDDLKRLQLARARELKQLKDEFRDVLEQAVPAPAPKKKAQAPLADQPPNAGSSPDQGGTGGRVSPGDSPNKGNTPTVKPDEQKNQPKDNKKTQPKKGGGR